MENYIPPTDSVIFITAEKIANANQRTNTPAISIARGSTNFTSSDIDVSTSRKYCAAIFVDTIFTVEVRSPAEISCITSFGKTRNSSFAFSRLSASFSHCSTLSTAISIASSKMIFPVDSPVSLRVFTIGIPAPRRSENVVANRTMR